MKIIPTLPVNNITLIGATGCQNKSVRKQVLLEVKSNGSTIPMTFLVGRDAKAVFGYNRPEERKGVSDLI